MREGWGMKTERGRLRCGERERIWMRIYPTPPAPCHLLCKHSGAWEMENQVVFTYIISEWEVSISSPGWEGKKKSQIQWHSFTLLWRKSWQNSVEQRSWKLIVFSSQRLLYYPISSAVFPSRHTIVVCQNDKGLTSYRLSTSFHFVLVVLFIYFGGWGWGMKIPSLFK